MIATLEKNMEENNLSQRYSTRIIRRDTRPVMVGDIGIGGDNPVRVQSMINEDTMDIEGSTAAIRRLHEVGCEIVRLTVPTLASAKAVGEIKKLLASTYQPVPLVADVHHNGMKIALEVAKHVDKVRINPGLFVFERPDPNRTEFSKDTIHTDNVKAKFGTGGDLEIYHDGSHSTIKEDGAGDLRIDGDGIYIRESDGTNQISAASGTATLYKDGTARLATSSSMRLGTMACILKNWRR